MPSSVPPSGPPSGESAEHEPPRVRVVELDRRSIVGLGAVILAMTTGYWLVRSTSRTTTWLVIAVLLALALDRVVGAVERRFRLSRPHAVGVVLAGAVLVVLTAAVLLVPPAIRQAQRFPDELPSVVSRLDELPLVGAQLGRNDVPAKVQDWIENLPERLGANTGRINDALRSVAGGLLAAFSVLLLTVVLLLDGQRLVSAGRRLVPPRQRAGADRIGRLLYRVVGQYFAGSLLVATLAGTGVLIMGLVLELPLAPLAGVWVMFTNLIPQIGGAAGAVPFVLLGLSQSPTKGVICAAYFLAYQQFENHVLGPTIVGEAVDLSPPATMMAALIGASAAGVPGALVSVPLVGVLKAVYLESRGRASGHPRGVPRGRRLARLLRVRSRRPRPGPPPPQGGGPVPS